MYLILTTFLTLRSKREFNTFRKLKQLKIQAGIWTQNIASHTDLCSVNRTASPNHQCFDSVSCHSIFSFENMQVSFHKLWLWENKIAILSVFKFEPTLREYFAQTCVIWWDTYSFMEKPFSIHELKQPFRAHLPSGYPWQIYSF